MLTSVSFLILSCNPKTIGISFYNVENLFDTINNPKTNDQDYTPTGKYKWDSMKYVQKIENLGTVISQLKNGKHPDIFGLCEIENKAVVEDLINVKILKRKKTYDIIHQESKDGRGIDVALVYDQKRFNVVKKEWIEVDLSPFGVSPTRDILYTVLHDKLDTIHIYVNHWPSRRGGKMQSEGRRIYVAQELYKHYHQLMKNNPHAKVIIMGDFNDEPFDKSIKYLLDQSLHDSKNGNFALINLFYELSKNGIGTYKFRDRWQMLDQMMVSPEIRNTSSTGYQLIKNSAVVFKKPWLLQTDEKWDGYPLRTYGGRKYLGGYSDHLPISILLEKVKLK